MTTDSIISKVWGFCTTLRDDGKQRSLNLHPMIAVDAGDGGLLGLVDAVFLSRAGGKPLSEIVIEQRGPKE